MKKVGIVTVYGEGNYGNKLQNFALVHIYKKMGADVKTLQVYQSAFLRTPKEQIYQLIKNIIATLPLKSKYKFMKLRTKKFHEFSCKYLNLTQKYYTKNIPRSILEKFDLLSIGSDQVWNDVDFDENDVNYFSVNKITIPEKISFAASIGKEKFSSIYESTFKANLKQFKMITCREMLGAEYLSELLGKECLICMDPTLFLDMAEWRTIECKPKWLKNQSYSLRYFLGGYDRNKIKNYEQENTEEIDLMDVHSEAHTASPEEFLYLIDHADMILTDSFHACVFSMIFGKKYIIFKRNKQKSCMGSRIDSLFKMFKINGQYESVIEPHDYREFDTIRQKNRVTFLRRLYNIVGDCGNED